MQSSSRVRWLAVVVLYLGFWTWSSGSVLQFAEAVAPLGLNPRTLNSGGGDLLVEVIAKVGHGGFGTPEKSSVIAAIVLAVLTRFLFLGISGEELLPSPTRRFLYAAIGWASGRVAFVLFLAAIALLVAQTTIPFGDNLGPIKAGLLAVLLIGMSLLRVCDSYLGVRLFRGPSFEPGIGLGGKSSWQLGQELRAFRTLAVRLTLGSLMVIGARGGLLVASWSLGTFFHRQDSLTGVLLVSHLSLFLNLIFELNWYEFVTRNYASSRARATEPSSNDL
jgi:hypothetical protein